MQRLLLAALVVIAVLDIIALGVIESWLQIFSTLLAHILKLLAR